VSSESYFSGNTTNSVSFSQANSLSKITYRNLIYLALHIHIKNISHTHTHTHTHTHNIKCISRGCFTYLKNIKKFKCSNRSLHLIWKLYAIWFRKRNIGTFFFKNNILYFLNLRRIININILNILININILKV